MGNDVAYKVILSFSSEHYPAGPVNVSIPITELVSKSTSGADGSVLNIAAPVVVACWLIGIIDSYRLGIIQEK
jgi:hypothetical protein